MEEFEEFTERLKPEPFSNVWQGKKLITEFKEYGFPIFLERSFQMATTILLKPKQFFHPFWHPLVGT